jgi:hypothetical protein
MPAPIDDIIKKRVVQQWLSGEVRDKIAADNNIGTGSVSSIIANYKAGLETLDFDSIRQLSIEIRKQGLNWSDLGSHFRLLNFIRKLAASEEKVESFIDNINSSTLPPEKVIEYVNQLFAVSREQSIPPDQVSSYIQQKIQEKQTIEEEIKQADAILQSKNANIEAINEHIQLNQKLNEHGLSMHNIDELLKLVLNAKRYGFEPKKIVGKLRSIQRLEKKGLENNCRILSNLLNKHKETVPLAELIEAMHIGKTELISFKIAVNEAAKIYGFSVSSAAFHVINNMRDYNRIGALKKELYELQLQKFAINQFCSRQSQALITLAKLQNHGITQDQIIHVKNFLENNGYNIDMKSTAASFK